MNVDRHLDWEGCFNARDLGGLHTVDGRMTRFHAVVRSDSLDRLTAAGWSALLAYGIRTIVDLRNDEERDTSVPRPRELTTVHVPLDDSGDTEFWSYWASGPQFGTPLYYRPFLERKPERCAAAIAAVACAAPGGVVVHCAGGRDRTGLVTLLLLALAGVAPEAVASDYELSIGRMRQLYASLGLEDEGPNIERFLADRNTTTRDLVLDLLASLDVDAYLRAAGLAGGDLARARARLLGPDLPGGAQAPPGRRESRRG